MRGQQQEVRSIVGSEGVLVRANHPALVGAAQSLLRAGELVPVLPGVYAAPSRASDRDIRIRAVALHEPDAVFIRRTAAQLTYWASLPGDEVWCAVPGKRPVRAGFRFVQRRVPPELVHECDGLRTTVPALTALDLCQDVGADGIDRALRMRVATLAGLHEAMDLTGGRRGNNDRRALLLDSRDEPWSAAERLCHRLLRTAHITGWRSNGPVVIEGRLFYVDVVFRALRLAVEIDGRIHEDDPDVFENDRWRQNALVLDGWMVLRFTWAMLRDHPDAVLETICRAIDIRRRWIPPTR